MRREAERRAQGRAVGESLAEHSYAAHAAKENQVTDVEIVVSEIREAEVPMTDALAAALERLERDAERWRYASTSRNFGISFFSQYGQGICYDELAKARIDAALAAEKAVGAA